MIEYGAKIFCAPHQITFWW